MPEQFVDSMDLLIHELFITRWVGESVTFR
jgi:hypothetical protein